MTLSVIIPTHNRAQSLTETIESVLAQRDETSIDIIVVDNNSTDNTRQEVARYAAQCPSVIRYASEKRTAFTGARSTGAEHAAGDRRTLSALANLLPYWPYLEPVHARFVKEAARDCNAALDSDARCRSNVGFVVRRRDPQLRACGVLNYTLKEDLNRAVGDHTDP
jgi:glycosyltransferase involved in cell wall biosynthesis